MGVCAILAMFKIRNIWYSEKRKSKYLGEEMKKIKALEFCVNGDGNKVCPPSKVICRKCLDKISSNLEKMVSEFGNTEEINLEGK
jgi:hypothetical protein